MAVTISGDVGTIITATGVFAGVIGNLFLQFRTLKATQENKVAIVANNVTTQAAVDTAQAAVEAVAQTNEKVEAVHKATNSLTDRLVALTKKQSYQAGMQDEKDRAAGLVVAPQMPLDVQPASEVEQAKEGIKQ